MDVNELLPVLQRGNTGMLQSLLAFVRLGMTWGFIEMRDSASSWRRMWNPDTGGVSKLQHSIRCPAWRWLEYSHDCDQTSES